MRNKFILNNAYTIFQSPTPFILQNNIIKNGWCPSFTKAFEVSTACLFDLLDLTGLYSPGYTLRTVYKELHPSKLEWLQPREFNTVDEQLRFLTAMHPIVYSPDPEYLKIKQNIALVTATKYSNLLIAMNWPHIYLLSKIINDNSHMDKYAEKKILKDYYGFGNDRTEYVYHPTKELVGYLRDDFKFEDIYDAIKKIIETTPTMIVNPLTEEQIQKINKVYEKYDSGNINLIAFDALDHLQEANNDSVLSCRL